jgi:hypothetical protein
VGLFNPITPEFLASGVANWGAYRVLHKTSIHNDNHPILVKVGFSSWYQYRVARGIANVDMTAAHKVTAVNKTKRAVERDEEIPWAERIYCSCGVFKKYGGTHGCKLQQKKNRHYLWPMEDEGHHPDFSQGFRVDRGPAMRAHRAKKVAGKGHGQAKGKGVHWWK